MIEQAIYCIYQVPIFPAHEIPSLALRLAVCCMRVAIVLVAIAESQVPY